jgi:hypothetical protein
VRWRASEGSSCSATSAPIELKNASAIAPVPIHPAMRGGSARQQKATIMLPASGNASTSQP